jgi:hypothetical protein
VAEQSQGEKPKLKTPMPQTPTTKILAVGTFDPGTLPRWQDRPVVFVGRPAGCRLHPEYDRHSGSARHAGGAATRQSPSDDVPAHADRSAQSPPPAAGTGCSALTVQLRKLARLSGEGRRHHNEGIRAWEQPGIFHRRFARAAEQCAMVAAQAGATSGVNSAAWSLTKSYMLSGFWFMRPNRSPVIRS